MALQNIRKLGEVCEFVRGPFGGSLKKSCFKESGYAVYEQQHAIYDQFDDIRYFIDQKKFEEMKRFELKSGDLIMSCSGTMGKVAIVPDGLKKGIINQALLKLTPKPELNVEYLRYWMHSPSFQEGLEKHTVGAAIKNVASVKILKTIELPIPKLSEQIEIVNLLKEAFAEIDKVKANIEKNIQNVQELFQSKLNEIFTQGEKGWEKKKIIDLCHDKSQIVGGPFGSNLKVKDYKESGIPILRLQNIGKGFFIDKSIKYVSEEKANELKYHSFKSGDIVLAKLGLPIGKTCIVPEKFKYGIVVADVVRLRPNKEMINYNFLKHFLNSDNSVSQLTSKIRGATRPRVNIKEVRNLKLSVPSLDKQIEICKKIDTLEIHRNNLISRYENKLQSLYELKDSILLKAFRGELTNKELTV
ncbi:MAG: restriction endonuclease subunit S [Flavobacteriaceae bacterium]|nr:restriction endonuclease subunit S [Flavobacteriaceae bacterium]